MVLAFSEADVHTYREPAYQDTDGNLYSVASSPVGDNFIGNATSALVRPEWDTEEVIDMAAAQGVQAIVQLWVPTEENPTPPLATPGTLLVLAGDDPHSLLEAAGLSTISTESTL
jgi:hypothetical protein